MTATHDLDAVLAQALAWRDAGRGVALATVIRTWGSSPRPAGSKLAVDDAGAFVGSVSGGCIEAAVIGDALEVIADGAPRVLAFGVSDAAAWEVGLACGGRVEVFVERVAPGPGVLDELLAARRAHRPVALETTLATGAHALVDLGLGFGLAPAAGDTATVRDDGVLVEPHLPPLRLIIVGAVHVAQPLAEMAGLAGFAVAIVDPRRAWATAVRFPGATLVDAWPDAALRALAPDARTAVVTLTHDPKLDDPALIAALATPAFYIGCLGSTKTHAARRARLADQVAAGALERLRGPVGLRIAARTPAEIAVSILAQIIAALRGAELAG